MINCECLNDREKIIGHIKVIFHHSQSTTLVVIHFSKF